MAAFAQPLEWGKLDPAYKACSQGHEQSPIDIRGAHLNKNLPAIEFHYLAGPMTLTNTGHTVQVTPPAGSYRTPPRSLNPSPISPRALSPQQ